VSNFLEQPDLVAITEKLAALYDFSGQPRDRRVLLEQAGLGRFIPGLDFSGNARTFCGDLVERLASYGAPLPEQPTKDPLGALLAHVIQLSDTAADSKKVFAQAIVKYALVNDAAYIERLRKEFDVALQPQRSAEAKSAAPPRGAAPSAEPSFTAAIEDQPGLERVINSEDNFLDIYLLSGALYCAQAVCRIEVPLGNAVGTGILIGPDLLLTNQHVLKSKEYLEGAIARFDYKLLDSTGVAPAGRVINLRGDFYFSSPSAEFDYALVKTESEPLANLAPSVEEKNLSARELLARGKHRGFVNLSPRFIREQERVNIIQHPDGDPLKVVMTQNYVVTDMTDRRVQYVADTMPGSSGSPVFNQSWELVALHHSGTPYPPDSVNDAFKKAWKGRFRVNEGIPARAILEDLKKKKLERYLPGA
jgi:V8-like Glu-specific endopeptidase